MEHRREPMGGEVDSDQVINSDWTNNNDTVDSSNQSPESVCNDHFVDHLTLKVRSLLSNWDECEPQANVQVTLKGKQPNTDSRQLFNVGATSHSSTVSNKGNNGAHVGEEIPTHNQTTNPDKPSKDSSLGFKRQGPSRFFDHSANPEDVLLMNNSVSQSSQLPKILINETEQMGLGFKACARSTAKVDACLSYDDFSNALQNLKDRVKHNRQQGLEEPCYFGQHDRVKHNRQQELEEPGYSGQRKLSLQKSYIFAGDSKTNAIQSYCPNPSTSKHLDARHESLENEAERSWSEITVRAESLVQPCKVSTKGSQKSLSEQDLVHLSLQGTNSITLGKDSFTSTSRLIGVNTMASNRVSLNPIDPSVNYNSSLADTPRIVVGSNITSSNASLKKMALNTNKDNFATDSRFNAGVASGNASTVEFNFKTIGGIDRRSRKSASNDESLSILDFNAATDSRFNAGVASGSASPVEFNSKGGIGRRSRKSTSKNESLSTVDFNSDQDTLASNSRSRAMDSASNNAPLNLIDFNAAHVNSLTSGSRDGSFNTAANNAFLNPADCNTGYRDNLLIAFRPGLLNNGNIEPPNLMDFDTVPKGNLMSVSRAPSGVGCSTSSRASMDDWRINLFDPSRNPLRDPELNYPSSDFDATERETPPLSASSMASSRRLEWDNGADIGYSIAILNPNFQGAIPEIARSDPEGISLMNETLNVGPSPISFPYLSFRSSGSAADFAAGSSQASSAGDADYDLVDRSSSPGSLSRSDSKKSVIYNSVRDMRRQSKSLSSKADSSHLGQPFRNLSCPNLTDLRNSLANHDWAKDNLSKSEEQVGAGKAMKTFLFPGSTTHRTRNVHCNRSRKVGPQSSSVMEDIYNRGDMLVAHKKSLQNVPQACKTCRAPLSLAGDQTNLSCSKSQNAAEERAFQFGPEEVEYGSVYDNNQVSQVVEWVDEFSDDYPHSRPILVVSNNSSKLKGGNLSKIVGSFFDNNAGTLEHSASGHSEVKPHIRWYPFSPTTTPQDIKDVSTQTAVSFVAQQLKETPAQAVFEQQTSSPEDVTIELPGRLGFSEPRRIPGEAAQEEDLNIRNISGVSTPESQAKPTNQNVAEVSRPDFSVLSTRILNLESGFLSSGDSQQDHMENRISDRQNVNAFQTCRSCHTDLNVAADGSLFSSRDERHQTLVASRRSPLSAENLSNADNNSTVYLEHSNFSMSGRLSGVTSSSYSSPGDLLMNPGGPRGERKLGVGECQRMPNTLQRDSSSSTTVLEGSRPRKDSTTASLPHSALQPFTPSDSSTRRNTTAHESAPPEKPSNVRNLVTALNHSTTTTQRDSENCATDFQFNSGVKMAITALNTFQDSIGSRTAIPGGNVTQTHSASGNRASDSAKFASVSQNRFPQNRTSTNLLDFLSQNRPFSDSKYLEQNEGMPKSFSDPLIAVHDQDESSEEDGGLVTFRSHDYEGSLGDSRLVPQRDQRQTPDVVYQQNPNITPPVDHFYSGHTLNRILLPNKEQKDSIDAKRRFIDGGHFQVSQSTSAIDDPGNLTRKQNRSLPGQLGSNSLFNQRDILHGNHRLEDARLLRATQSTLSSGDSFSNDINSPIRLGGHGDAEFRQSMSLNFPQTLENARRVDIGVNVGNPSLQMKGVAQTQSRINTTHFFSQLQEDSERPCHSQLSPPLSMMYDARDNGVNAAAENNTRKYSSKNISQFGEVSGIRSQAMQQPNNAARRIIDSNVQVQTQSDIGDRSTSSNHLPFVEDSHRQSQTKPRLSSKSSVMNDGRQKTTNTPIEIGTHESLAVRHENVFDSNRSQARQQLNESTARMVNVSINDIKNGNRTVKSGFGDKSSSCQLEGDFSKQYPSRPQPNDATTRIVDSPTNDLKSPNNTNQTIQSRIGDKSINSCRIQDEIWKQNPPRLRSGSNTYPFLTRWDSDYAMRDPLVANRNFVSVGIQASGSSLEMEKCTFCHQSKSSHFNHCPQKDKFKVILGQALERRRRRGAMCGKSGTSFCVFSKVCFCCCNKTLQEAFNFHRAEIVERIEARQKEAETRTGKSLFLNLAPPAATHQQNSKQRLEPVTAKPTSTSRPHSNKENIKKNVRNYSAPTSNSSKQKCRLKNLTKYNRVMSKIYSQRLKSEILKGKVNFSRHEILMNS